jgi:transcriptional regulator with XRE-family HTH domain
MPNVRRKEKMDTEDACTFGKLLHDYRKGTGISQRELATKVGVSRMSIWSWEHDEFHPQQRYSVTLIAKILKLSPLKTDRLLYAAGYSLENNSPQEQLADITPQPEKPVALNTKSKPDEQIPELESTPPVERLESAHSYFWDLLDRTIFLHYTAILTSLYLGLCMPIFLFIWRESCRNCELNFFSNIYLVIPFTGALLGWTIILTRPRLNTNTLASEILLCTAPLVWSVGNSIWMYQNFVNKTDIPYPSFSDVGYLTNNVLLAVATYLLLKTFGAGMKQKRLLSYVWAGSGLGLGLIMLMLKVRGWQLNQLHDPMKFVLDVSLPFTSGCATFATWLGWFDHSFRRAEGLLKRALGYITVGVTFLFISDVGFSWTTSLPKSHVWAYYNGGWVDFCIATAFYFLCLGVVSLTYWQYTNRGVGPAPDTMRSTSQTSGKQTQSGSWSVLDPIFFAQKDLPKLNLFF